MRKRSIRRREKVAWKGKKKSRETHRKVHCAFQLSKEQYGIAWIKARVVHEKSTRRVVV